MPANIFISFAHVDYQTVLSIRALAKNPNHELVFHDRSEIKPVKDKKGTPLPYPPDDIRAAPIREELKRLLQKATKMLVIISETTHESKWVNWEIQTFFDMKSNLDIDATERIRGMIIEGCKRKELPRRIRRLRISTIEWNLAELNKWFQQPPHFE